MRELLTKPWVRIALFFWIIVFPIMFIGLPLLKVATGEAAFTMAPIWGLAVWVLSPFAVSVVLKYLGTEKSSEKE